MVQHVSVIGAGTMGRGIAYTCAAAGLSIAVHDIDPHMLKTCKEYIAGQFQKASEKELLTVEQANAYSENILYTTSLEEATEQADLVIEAVLEIMELKIKIFKQLDKFAPKHAILATNTSTMSPTEIGAQTSRPSQCIALHFFNPVPKMKLIEVICGLETSEDTVAKSFQFGEKIKKECVRINEFPGFAVSRMNCLIGNEAMKMVMEGVGSINDIDKAMKLGLNHPMGPLELADLVGLDTRLRNMEYLYKTLGETYRPCPILTKYVKAGRLGKKTGRGFYEYDHEK
ncbi:3-hydroxyacyl-CoA dehydrogenase NAD-binding domain-containing protein [Priestia aryabhattai]|uniref:3-hydroxyacyl-CoA dehydrogenase family protein n=1 Tax=Priestia TaxID=2800373 RepID=UPI0003A2D199|nr:MULTISPECIES: 3-hydroxyacyl-CoA dehydrogenase NAD-binding domain-containing protein [Priestia]NHH94694.1 putative 3-hydroxybutyryl-CoA dehydrogenase [Bacillus sp. MB95]AWD66703.1 3-hydroxyacyl-CoA dehydrogenase [Priestia megaterium]MBY0077709.1 3-hydroxyacyl-CoA dehydrogenase [Priestia aryabhattai]MBY0211626.1 3-hydroxyacyl-CoA dehydrogenase [Priestia aryabhattai]MDT0149301.1 3-hydroxyacyl-CoA dehydrogenase NAD-binding domain-containing protein [Priestia aryabhattai]